MTDTQFVMIRVVGSVYSFFINFYNALRLIWACRLWSGCNNNFRINPSVPITAILLSNRHKARRKILPSNVEK